MKKISGRISGMLAILLACAIFLNNGNIYSAFAAGKEGASSQAQPDEGTETGDNEQFEEGGGTGGNEQPGEGDGTGGDEQPGEGDGTGGDEQPGEGDGTGGDEQPGEGDGTGGDEQPGEGDGTGEDEQPGEGDGTGEEEQPGEGDGIGGDEQPGEGDGTGEEEQPGEGDGTEGDEQIDDDDQQIEDVIPDADDEKETDEDTGEIPLCLEGKEHEYEIIMDEEDENVIFRCVFCQREIDAETYEEEDAVLHEHVWSRPEGELVPLCEACSAQRLDCDGEEGYGIHIFELIQEEGMPDRYRCAICGEEKETLDEWDMTLEMFQEIWGISLYASIDMGELGIATIPADLTELQRQINEEGIGTEFDNPIQIRALADLMVLQDLSAEFDFEGLYVAFTYADTQSEQVWDLTKLSTVGYEGKYFTGIGTADVPFKGILCSAYRNSYSYRTSTPLFNYLGTGATVEDMPIEADITGDGTDPVGIIARHVVNADESGIVNLKTVTVSGTVTNHGAAAGGLFGEIINSDGADPIKIQYTNSDPEWSQLTFGELNVNAGNAGGMAGRTVGPVEIYLTDVFPKGTITGTDAAGMLAGSMEPGGTLNIKGAEDGGAFSVNVKGSGASGGLVGKTDQVKILQDSQNQVIIAGNVEGGTAGGLFGECIETKVRLDHITISSDASVTASSQDAGGVIGRIQGALTGSADLESENWHQLHHITIEGNISGGWNAGGVVGCVEASNFRIGLPEEPDNFECIQMTGTVSAANSAGGMIGAAKGQYIEVHNSSASGNLNGTERVGGIFGNVESNDNGEHTVVRVSNVKVSSTMSAGSDSKIYGGIFGQVQTNSMAALDKKINVDDLQFNISNTHEILKGYIAGTQTEALIYFEESCEYTKPGRYDPSTYPNQLPGGTVWVDDIGEYGGVYRNGSWGEGQEPLISYAKMEVSGTVGRYADGWELDSEADIMRLAIMLNTEGNFAGGCFGNSSKSDLLKGNYLLTKSDYALENSGIYALNRNDQNKSLSDEQCFTGSFAGSKGARVVLSLGRCVTYQYNIALFPKAGDGAEFSDLEIKRDIFFAKGAAGLAVNASDNIKVENVDIEMELNSNFRAIGFHYGGMFADYNAGAGTCLSVSNSRIGGKLKIYEGAGAADKQYLGGLIAKYESGATGAGLPQISIDGLEIAAEINSDSRVASGMITEMNAGSGVAEDKVILALQNIHVKDGAKLTITDSDDTGGFLGRMWYGVVPYEDGAESYSIKGLKVGDNDTTKSPQYTSNGLFGGMVCTVRGRIQLKDTKINNLVINSKTDRNGLLFRNGHNALIELEGYQIAGAEVGADNKYPSNGKVRVTGAANNFSDIVGNNIVDENGYTSGGIVNIISPAFEEKFYSYSSHNLGGNGGSRYTRYYYNLFGTSMSLQAEENYLKGNLLDPSNVVITNADQMMIWHLFQYMDGSIKRYLSPYFSAALPQTIAQVTISGTIDLNHRSYYPTPVSGCTINGVNGAKIIFYGDKIEAGESGKRPRDDKENYMMHSGLLLSPAGTVTVQGDKDYLTLSGMVSHVDQNSGALFSRAIGGNKSIYRIKLEDCYVYSYGGAIHEVGLLIGAVNDGIVDDKGKIVPTVVDISWIKTEGYQQRPGWTYAGSALIGRVGSSDAKNLEMDLTNIKIHDKTNTNGGIFRWASLIDYYQYTQSTEENNVRVRYLFTQEAYKGEDDETKTREPFDDDIHGHNKYAEFGSGEAVFVTIGKELKDGVEYWNIDEEPADFLKDYEDSWEQYLPYVCKTNDHVPASRDIEVNPKNTGILNGCGTYEDPYVIRSAKQILALACYLSSKEDGNNNRITEKYLEGWKIRPVGCKTDNGVSGTDICNTHHDESTLVVYGKEGFPTRDELRQAYYIIVEDIDFSHIGSATDNERARSFVGIGTEEFPFSGVIIGQKTGDTMPKITLPYKAVSNESDSPNNFGLIQYAKGAVVKDLEIVSPEQSTDNQYTNVIRVANMGSPVIACILGGDNIIDNVKTGGLLAVKTSGGNDTAIGGYAGVVQQGSLILRNLEESNFTAFECGKLGDRAQMMSPLGTNDISSSYPYLSAAIGKVENGYVIYEDTGYSGTEIVLTHEPKSISDVYTYNTLPFSNTYDVIRASGMKDQIGKIKITQNGINFDCTIANAQQLQLVSMAINSDSFSVYYGGGGYDRLAVCRKAKYDEVGHIDPAAPGEEYQYATGQDDKVYWYPYIYQYFDFNDYKDSLETYTESKKPASDSRDAYRSRLNAVTAEVSSVMTYHLQDDTSKDIDYDLSGYKRGFRGLGATYRVFSYTSGATGEDWISLVPAATVYSDFRANFDGHGATVKAEMINDYASEIHTTALFNDLVNTGAAREDISYTIEDLVVTGTFISCFAQKDATGTTADDAINYKEDRAAALVGMMLYPFEITNVTVKDVEVRSKGHAAGIVAWINPSELTSGSDIEFVISDCEVNGESAIYTKGGSSGGIVGVMASQRGGMDKTGFYLNLENCKVHGESNAAMLQISNDGKSDGINNIAGIYDRYARGRSGAFIGYAGVRQAIGGHSHEFQVTIKGAGSESDPDVKYVSVNGAESAGGIIGEYTSSLTRSADRVSLHISDIVVSSSILTGKNANVDTSAFGIGGIIGTLRKSVTCKVENVKVIDTNIYSGYSINGAVSDAGISQGDLHAGGIVGSYYHENSDLTLAKVSVTGTLKDGRAQYEILSRLSDAGGIIGASVISGSAIGTVTITNATVTGMNIQSDNRSQADKGADIASGSSKRSAGGMIGQAVRTNLDVQSAKVDTCTIRSGIGSAGGVIGSAGDGSDLSVLDTVLNTVTVTNSTIGTNGKIAGMETNAGIGGIYGNLRGAENQGSQMLHGISVENCTLYGKNTGGIAGAVDTGQQIGNIWSSGSGIVAGDGDIRVNENQLLGFTAGGVFGLDQSKETCFEKVAVTDNVILACGNGDHSAAGGFSGRKENSGEQDDSHTLNSIRVEGNRIFSNDISNSGKQSAGGIFGYLELTQEVYSDKATVKNNHIGYHEISEDIKKAVSETEVIEGQMNAVSQGLKALESETASLWNGNGYAVLPADLKEDTIGRYAAYFGNLAGSYTGSGHAYFLEPEVIYDDANAAARPVVDVGSPKAVTATGNKMLSDPYAYRENIHVIYFEPDGSAGNTAAGAWGAFVPSLGKDVLFSQVNAEKELEEYSTALESGADTKKLLDAYRLNMTDDNGKDVQEVFRLVYQNQDKEYLSPFEISGQVLPMIYIDMQYGTVDQLLTSVLAALTNAGGVLNSGNTDRSETYDAGIGQIMELSVEPYQIVNGVISKGTGTASVEIRGDENRWEVSYNGYDTAEEDKANGTFSLLTVVYSQKSYQTIDNEQKEGAKIVLRIPVFVEERLTIDTHLKIIEAEVYNAEKAKEEGAYTKPVLANDSSYTLYLEYIYGSARNKYSTDDEPLVVDKKLEMTAVDGNDTFWKGTRLTLIDVTDSDKVYYYTVTGNEEKEIPFTSFKDANGVPYQPQAIHDGEGEEKGKGKEIYEGDEVFVTKDTGVNGSGVEEYRYQDVAVEKFLIVVDTSGVEKEIKTETQDIRGFHVTPELKIPENSSLGNIEERTTITEHTVLNVTRQATLDIGFLKKGEEDGTNVTGSLQSGDEITVDVDFQITGKSLYWSRLYDDDVTLIDSANSNKYLEVGIYLTDTNGNRVRLPDNTNVTVNGWRIEPVQEETKKEENLGAFVNRTEAYFYKDGKIQFSMNDLRKIMEEPYKQGKLSLEEKLKFVFEFSNADLSAYTDDEYQVHIELLRIEDKDYPAGGEIIDTHSSNVEAKIRSDLACALEAKDLMELGINTYQNITPMPHMINFDFMLDFNYILSDTNETWNKQQIEDRYFTVTYHILEKKIVDGVTVYVPYTGDQLSLELVNPPDPSNVLQAGESSEGELINSKYITYQFKLSEVKQGTGNAGKGVITRSLVLTVNDAEKMELSNYKIQASVRVSDDPPGDIEKQVNSELSDFFIFTVADLKTDLDGINLDD